MRRIAKVLAALALSLGWILAPAQARPTVTVTRVSGDSPFADGACLSTIDTSVRGADAHGLERQPSLSWSRGRPIVAWGQDDGLGNVAAHADATGTWQQVVPPGVSMCAPGADGSPTVADDPRVFPGAMATDGAGVTVLATSPNVPPDASGRVIVSTSSDGGVSWSQPTLVSLPVQTPVTLLSVSADPSDPHAIAVTWATPLAAGQTWFTRSTDDGKTWSVPKPIHSAPTGVLEVPGLVTLSDGTLVIVEWNEPFTTTPTGPLTNCRATPIDPRTCGTQIYALRSSDHGTTWTTAPIASFPNTNWLDESVNVAPPPVLGPRGKSANVLIPFDSADGTRTWRIYRSADGTDWRDIGVTVPLGHKVFAYDLAPSFAFTDSGDIGVLYADHSLADRPTSGCDDSGAACRTDEWLTYSTHHGTNWSTVHLGGPFDLNKIPSTYLGDLADIQAHGDTFGAVFPLGACEQPFTCDPEGAVHGADDVYFATVRP